MADSLFGGLNGLGGLMKGLSSFMPQDDPNTKVFNAMNELDDLKKNETELYANIGKRAYQSICNLPDYADLVNELNMNQTRQVQTKEKLDIAQKEKDEKEQKEKEETDARTCPNCETVNPEGMKFCQECGTKLGAPSKCVCPGCGANNPPQTRFCGECGAKL